VLRQAFQDATSWPDAVRVAVNLSVTQFRRTGIVELVKDALRESGLPAHRVEVDVAERVVVEHRNEIAHSLRQLKALGVRVAVDDFGTGYSSFSDLQSFSFEKVKIDRSVTGALVPGGRNASIVKAISALARNLGMRVGAEGVEYPRQAQLLAELECDELQGYLIAKPMPAAAAADFIGAKLRGSGLAAASSGRSLTVSAA
jgi:EAL domain-containing protein (putative c-di-GMP-specific phosphodiesterase class I)